MEKHGNILNLKKLLNLILQIFKELKKLLHMLKIIKEKNLFLN